MAAPRPQLLAVQASGIIDHCCNGASAPRGEPHFCDLTPHRTCAVDFATLREFAPEAGGSQRVPVEEVERLIAAMPPAVTAAGGSAANTLRGLASGFAVPCGVVGAVGADAWGREFDDSLREVGVDTSRLHVDAERCTGRCAVLITPDGQRTMRTALATAASLRPEQVRASGSSWAGVQFVRRVVRASCVPAACPAPRVTRARPRAPDSLTAFAFYCPGLVDAVADVARSVGARLVFHLASFEVVRAFWAPIVALLASGDVAVVFANEDEARQLMLGYGVAPEVAGNPGACGVRRLRPPAPARSEAPSTLPAEAALQQLAQTCSTAVVTLGAQGCVARQGTAVVRVPAIDGVQCVDSTGAGDLFAAGFMFGVIENLTLASCMRLGCLSGAAVIKVRGRQTCVAVQQ